MNPWGSPALRKTAEARTPSSSNFEKVLPETRKCLFIRFTRDRTRSGVSFCVKHVLVEHVLNVDVRRTSRYAQYAIVHAKCAKHYKPSRYRQTEMSLGGFTL